MKNCNKTNPKASNSDYICNPLTGRWVKKTSATGRNVLQQKNPSTQGIYITDKGKWRRVNEDEKNAFKDFLKNHEATMYSMGGHEPPIYGENEGTSVSNGKTYNFIVHLESDDRYIELDDGRYHQILDITLPAPYDKYRGEFTDKYGQLL